MTDTMANFSAQMQISMKAMQNRIDAFNASAKSGAGMAEAELRRQMVVLDEQAQKAEDMLKKARTDFAAWADEPLATVAGWKAKFETAHLVARADRATRYAEAASQVALATVTQAEKAALDAKLARAEAEASQAAAPKVAAARAS